MPTPKKGPRLGGSPSHQRRLLSNLAASLFEHDSIRTTDAKAKALRPYAEKLITKAKDGSLAKRREVLAKVPNKPAVARLFDELAPQFEGRDGGYTRIIKLENRVGDNAPMSQISLVLEPVEKKDSRSERVAASKAADEDAKSNEPAEETQADPEAEAAAETYAAAEAAAGEADADSEEK